MHRSVLPLALALALFALPAAAQPALFTPAEDARAALSPRQAELLGHLETSTEATGVQLVRVDLGALDAAAVTFNLAADATVTLSHTRSEQGTYGITKSFDSDDAGSFAVLVVREGQLTGNVRVGGQLHAIRPLTGGLHAVTRVDEDQFVDHPPGWEAVEDAAAMRYEEEPYVPHAAPSPEGGDVTQRVLVPYTPNADAQVGDILALIQLAVAETNLGYDESDVSVELLLAHAYMTPQNEGSFSTTLQRMANPTDGFHDEIPGLRAEYHADLVNMIAGSAGGLCGTAFTILADGPDEGFAVTAQNCATGYYSFGHELGHLQGARHNVEIDNNSSPFPYGHGKCYSPGNWRTTMSYGCPGSTTRILRWSNPDVLYNGEPLGDAALRDNARVLDETAADIAAFYPEPAVGVAMVAVTRLGPGTLPAAGGPMPFEVTVSNASGALFDGEAWVSATLPSGSDYGPLFGPRSVTLADGDAVTRTLTANVPALAPPGLYTITVSAGPGYPSDVDDTASFTFTKAASLTGEPAEATARWTVTEGAGTPEASAAAAETPTGGVTLLGTFPNPTDGAATVRYAVGEATAVRVSVHDVLGREVAVLADGPHAIGRHAAPFDAEGLPSGVYVVRVQTDTAVATQRVTLTR